MTESSSASAAHLPMQPGDTLPDLEPAAKEKRRLFVFLMLVTTLIAAVSTVAFIKVRDNIGHNVQDTLTTIAEQKRQHLEQILSDMRDDATLFALGNAPVATMIERWVSDQQQDGRLEETIRERLAEIANSQHYALVAVFDAEGHPVCVIGSSDVRQQGAAARKAVQNAQSVFVDLHRDSDGLIKFGILSPIMPHGQTPNSALYVARDAPVALYPLVGSWPLPTTTAETFLVRREDEDVVFLSPLRHRDNAELNLRYPLTTPELPAAAAAQGYHGVYRGRDYRRQPVLAYATPVAGSPWSMVAKMDETEAFAAIRSTGWTILVLAALVLILAYSSGYTLWRRQVQRQQLAALKALQASEARFRRSAERLNAATQGAGIGIWEWEVEAQRLEWDDGMYRIYGLPAGSPVSYATWLDLLEPEVREQQDAIRRKFAETDKDYHSHFRIKWPNGEVRHLRSFGRVDPAVKPRRVVGVSWDVTDQQRVEDALRKSTARFDELVRRIPVGLFTFRLRADGSMGLDYVSPKFCELLDLDGEFTSLDVRTVLARVHPEDHDDFMRAVEVGRQTRESTEWEGRVIVRAETEWIRIEADPSRSGSPSSDTLWNGVIINITQRKRTERALSELMEEQQLILDSVPAMIWYKDTSNRMLRVNQAVVKSLGVPKEQIEGKHTAAFYPEDADRYYRDDLTVIDTGEPRLGIEEPYRLPAGEKRWICTDKVPLKDASGRVTRLLVMSVDITERKLTEEALRRSEQQIREQHAELELIYQNAPIGLCLIDGEFRFLRINDQLAKINGSSVEAHRGCTVGQLLPDLADTLEPLCRLALETGEPVTDVEVQGVTPAQPGVERVFRVSLIPLRDKDGSILGIGCVVQEVTERKRAERALIEAQQRLLAIMEAVPIGISFSSDPSCTQVTGNPAVLAQFELHSGDNLSASARDHAAPGRHLRYFRDDQEMADVELPLQRAVAENRVIPPIELEVELPSGRRWFAEASAAPIHDAQGQVIGGVAVTVDITDRKRAELDRQKFVSLADHSAEFVGMCDMNFLPFYVNAAGMRLVGLESLEEACRTPVQDFFFADDQRFILEEFFPQVLRDGHGEIEIRFRHFQTGDPIWMIYNVFYLLGARGEPIGFGTVSRDITERKQTEEALRNADRNKDEFLATLAHELRNPLVPLRNALHLLRLSDGEGPATIARVREMMERQVNHMVRLVDDLLEVSRITRGKIELKKEPVALRTIIDHAVEISRPHIEASRHRLTVSVPPESLTLDADPIRLSQVFANLLNNAAKYTEAGGQIWLTAQRQGDEAVVSVRDTGLGIPADRLSRVFDLFAQFDPGGRHIQSGLGIGLALTRSLVQLHGGRVEARSDGAGQGSEFLVYLPLTATQPAEEVTPETQQLALGSNLRILVVDDNTDVADSLGMVLRVLGAEVRVVYNGSAALEAIDVFNPTVVLLDVGMPEMDGYEVARQIRQQPRFHEVKLIALTGWGQEDDRRRSRAAGFDHHLVKPVDIDVLQTVLTELEESD